MSSANSIKSPDKETGTQSRPQRPSYAKVTSTHSSTRTHSPTRDSLKATVHDNTVHSNVWKAGGSPASCTSLFFDFTSRSENRATLLCHINASFPNNCGARLHSDHARRIVELFIDDSNVYQKACTSGLVFKDGMRILPSVPLPADSCLIHLRLSSLPFTSRDKLTDGICKALSPFGDVLDYGILRDHDSNLFMGHGYATLNVSSSKQSSSLSHKISWPNSEDWFYATWAEMPLHCLHCHKSGHSKSSCPTHPSRNRPCWSCGQNGHRAAKCPNHRPIVKPTIDPPMSPSSSTSTATSSQSSDVSMFSTDISPIEAHNDMIISNHISEPTNDKLLSNSSAAPPSPHFINLLLQQFPMSDEAKEIIRTTPVPILSTLHTKLCDQGKRFPPTTITSNSSGSVSSMRLNDSD
ncbi:hypothetical protein O0I10_006809 [Lichtheimia ornata]|uniref:CCHC-type domain-containing protein n=1 Tax=Lichtheimia ornata TaxID=688661 RepID=A0AAD7V2R0_9FUNG|nr:uncharacterized protein O0I10_007245 [Lichtheimia ornata]XP_058342420.1 uncharacterized protein O0I10_006809 [Lichtheimia ornata]KAJ8657165.1 hypothetical protein O0I10_007245 [Lichtheimia ornata]KAJ8657507.1 hypothetical protein O0I10_006809 [Lichtheimia ornata]